MQIAAHPWRDDIALAAALALETAWAGTASLIASRRPDRRRAIQTARWLAAADRFLEDCRRRYGDAFSVNFTGLQDAAGDASRSPDAIRALYARARRTRCRRAARPRSSRWSAPRSLLLLEGAEHLSRRKVMLPPFRGDRMRAYEPIDARGRRSASSSRWPVGEPFAVHP